MRQSYRESESNTCREIVIQADRQRVIFVVRQSYTQTDRE